MSKKILIIGNSAKEYALAKKMSEKYQVFVAPGNDAIKEFATVLDIREDSVSEILDFVMENDIDITIPVSENVLKTDIVNLFNINNQRIFAPSAEITNFIYDKALTKKMLYKLNIPTPKFGIFEKQNIAVDYIKNLKIPFVIKTNERSSAVVLTSQKSAKMILDSGFAQKNQKVLIEDYVWGTPFVFYVISDGYKALPIGSSNIYKHSLEGDGGQLTSGMGACSPNYKISADNEYFIMDNIIYPILEHFENNGTPYLGFMGINGVLTEEGDIQVLGIETFMQDCDASAIIELIDTDIYSLIDSCILGVFSDEVEYVPQKELFATSVVFTCKNKENNENTIIGLDYLDESIKLAFYPSVRKNKYLEFEAEHGSVFVLTSFGRTVTSSVKKAYDEAENIKYNGLFYRKDISKPLITNI